jgi:hypothetical protein
MTRRLSLLFAAALLSVGLTGCSIGKQPAPEEVLAGFYNQLSQLQTAHYSAILNLRGGLTTTLASSIDTAQIKLTGDLVNQLGQLPYYSVNADVSATGGQGPIKIDGNLIALDDYTYFQLTDLVLPTLLPVSLGADKKWYKIQTEQGGSKHLGGRELASLTPQQELTIRNLVSESNPFTVSQVFPVTTVNGQRAYHYKVKIDPAEVEKLLNGIAKVSKNSKPIPDLSYLANYEPDVYIATKNHQLLRLATNGIYTHGQIPTDFDLTVDLTNHNAKIDLSPPSSSESIDTAKLFNLPKLPF